jgi:hypothetical protein
LETDWKEDRFDLTASHQPEFGDHTDDGQVAPEEVLFHLR